MNQQEKNIIFYIGIVLIVLGFIGLTLLAFFAVIGLPLLIFGLIFILFSKRRNKIKLLIVSSSIAFIVLFNVIWRWTNTVGPEVFLIPEGYTGKVNIIYGQKCAKSLAEKDGKKIYSIPSDGILLTSTKFKSGFIDNDYFYVDKRGKKTKLEMMDVRDFNESYTTAKNPHEPPRNKLGVFHWGRVGSVNEVTFLEFYVSSYNNLSKKFGFKYEQKFDSLERRKIKACK